MADHGDKGGIQLLLAAEQDAQQVVSNARAAKTARLRQAKEEAEREASEYRAQREAEFKQKVSESSGNSGQNVQRLEGETASRIEALQSDAAELSSEIVNLLLKYVTTVRN